MDRSTYTAKELAEKWGVSVMTIYRLTQRTNPEERLPAFKIGKSIRIPAAEADAYFEGHRVIPPPYVRPVQCRKQKNRSRHQNVYYVGWDVREAAANMD